MKNLIKACIAMAAFAAIFVLPSVASASLELTAPTGTRYTGKIIATNVAHAETAKHTLMTLPTGGSVTCDIATLTGPWLTDETSSGEPQHVLGEIETAEFKGASSANCTSPFGNVTVTPNHTQEVHWCITAGKEDKFTVWTRKNGSCHNGETSPLVFTLDSAIAGPCTYSKNVLEGTYTTHPADLIGTLNQQEFVKTAGSGFCPASGKLDMAFTLTEDLPEHKEGNPIYIDKKL